MLLNKRAFDRLLKTLGTEYLDVFQLFWLGRTSIWTSSTVDALVSLRESGKVRAIGLSTHDRKRAGKLAGDSPLDVLMVRYNAAHTGAEQDIFPHLAKRKPAIIAYTATRWRGLLKRPRDWSGPVMTAVDCYRFCLSNPHVDIVQQLQENLSELRDKGPLSEEENGWIRNYGQIVYKKSSRFTFRF
ncbi:MAG: aldo/keto reductase [Desulfobacterales bacterium]